MTRLFDILLSFLGLVLLSPIMILIFVFGFFDSGSPLFFQKRIGRFEKPFIFIKFRSMSPDSPSVASHIVDSSKITKFGHFLRKTKLDELPQLWNVLKGDMSLVGPRPGLFNQEELFEVRKRYGVFNVRPGMTGLSQVNNIDMSTPKLLAEMDAKMIETLNIFSYFKYIILTIIGKGQGDAARH